MPLLAKGCDQESAQKIPHEIHIPFNLILPRGTLFLLEDGNSVVDELDFRAWDSTGNLLDLWLNDTVAPTQTAPVPKPATALLAAVAGGLLTFRRKRKDLSIFSPKASPKDGQSARLA